MGLWYVWSFSQWFLKKLFWPSEVFKIFRVYLKILRFLRFVIESFGWSKVLNGTSRIFDGTRMSREVNRIHLRSKTTYFYPFGVIWDPVLLSFQVQWNPWRTTKKFSTLERLLKLTHRGGIYEIFPLTSIPARILSNSQNSYTRFCLISLTNFPITERTKDKHNPFSVLNS